MSGDKAGDRPEVARPEPKFREGQKVLIVKGSPWYKEIPEVVGTVAVSRYSEKLQKCICAVAFTSPWEQDGPGPWRDELWLVLDEGDLTEYQPPVDPEDQGTDQG